MAVETEQAASEAVGENTNLSVLTGEPLPSTAAVSAARMRNLHRGFAERKRLLADTIGVSEVADLLYVGRQTPHDRLNAETLLAVKDRGQWRFPSWQFDPDGPDGVVAGLPETLRALRGPISQLGRVRWFVTPKGSLNDRTPLEALHHGDLADVIATAEALGAS